MFSCQLSRAVRLFPIHCEEPELASVSGSPLRPAAAWRSSMSLTETLLRLIQGEIMGPATPNPLKSHSTARMQAGREAQWSTGWTRLPTEQLFSL